MDNQILKAGVTIDLSEGVFISDIDKSIETLRIYNTAHNKLLKAELLEVIGNISNLDRIKVLHISGRFDIDDCEIVKLFPNIKCMWLGAEKLSSLKGLEYAKQLMYLELLMKRGHKTNIEAISNTNITSIRIEHPTNLDLKVLAQCDKLRNIELVNCDEVDLELLNKSLVEELQIVNATNQTIGHFGNLAKLKSLCIAYCKNLNKITNINPNINEIWIETCNKLDMNSISQFTNTTTLTLKKCKNQIDLNILNFLEKLHYVNIQVCNIDVTKKVILDKLHSLKEVVVSKISDDNLIRISKDNPSIIFKNVNIEVLGGYNINKSVKYSMD
jgi:hypothetical protein